MFSHPPSFRRLVTTFKPSSLCCGGFSSQHSMLRYHSSIQTHANYYTNMIQLQQEQEAFNPFEGKTEGLKKIDFVHVLPSDVVKNKRELLVEDMIAVNEKNVNSNFYKDHLRKAALNWRKEIKKLRRVDLGPFASATFENYDINWIQCHEMVLVEKGTNEQFSEEGRAYDPLVPKGNNIAITFMFEIDNEPIRKATLKKLGRIEYNFKLQICKKGTGELITSLPCKPTEDGRTTNDGMTSAVHFFSVPFSKEQIQYLRDNLDSVQVKLTVDDERYPHSTVLSPLLVKDLLKEFD